ncbi:MAG: hypothetical protein IJ684_03720 [Bacteroidales bacterium]|nr:hypothetical protein [Bacteroidales bacterium]
MLASRTARLRAIAPSVDGVVEASKDETGLDPTRMGPQRVLRLYTVQGCVADSGAEVRPWWADADDGDRGRWLAPREEEQLWTAVGLSFTRQEVG